MVRDSPPRFSEWVRGRYALYLLLAITGPGVLAQNASLLGKIQGGELIG